MSDENNTKIPNKIAFKVIWQNYFRAPYHKIKFSITKTVLNLSQWAVLRTIGNQKIIQFTILVPAIGYYIIFSTQFCDFTATDIDIGISCIDSRPSKKTFELYFAFVSLGLASLFYTLSCPKIIKQYENNTDLIDAEEPHLSNSEIKKYSLNIYKLLNIHPFSPFNNEIKDESAFRHAAILSEAEINLKNNRDIAVQTRLEESVNNRIDIIKKDHKANLLKCVYFLKNISRTKTRITILTLYILGFAILLWHGVATFLSIYAIYYNSTPTHFIRQIVEYITTLF